MFRRAEYPDLPTRPLLGRPYALIEHKYMFAFSGEWVSPGSCGVSPEVSGASNNTTIQTACLIPVPLARAFNLFPAVLVAPARLRMDGSLMAR